MNKIRNTAETVIYVSVAVIAAYELISLTGGWAIELKKKIRK